LNLKHPATLFLSCLAFALLAGCHIIKPKPNEEPFIEEFIAACSAKGTSQTICRCLFNELRKDYELQTIQQWSSQSVPKKAAEKAAQACRAKLTQ